MDKLIERLSRRALGETQAKGLLGSLGQSAINLGIAGLALPLITSLMAQQHVQPNDCPYQYKYRDYLCWADPNGACCFYSVYTCCPNWRGRNWLDCDYYCDCNNNCYYTNCSCTYN